MKRVVRSSLERYSQVSNEYNEALARVDKQKKVRHEQESNYNKANHEAERSVSEYVADVVRRATSESFMSNIDVDTRLFGYSNSTKFAVHVEYGRESRYSDSADVALRWEWRVTNDKYGSKDNEVMRETSSWSGLNGTTSEQLSDLRMSVNALEALSNITDEQIVRVATSSVPRYNDYVTQDVDSVKDSDYVLKQLDALTGEDVFVEGHSDGPFSRSIPYYKITKDTGKQYSVEMWLLRNPYNKYNGSEYDGIVPSAFTYEYEKRFRKDKLADNVKKPITPVTEEQIKQKMDKLDRNLLETQNS